VNVLVTVGAAFVVIAAVCVVALALRVRRVARLRAVGVWATGVVTNDGLAGDDGMIFVKWSDEAGNEHTTYSTTTSSFFPREGEPARVLYDPKDISTAEIEAVDKGTRIMKIATAAIFTVIGAGLIVYGFTGA